MNKLDPISKPKSHTTFVELAGRHRPHRRYGVIGRNLETALFSITNMTRRGSAPPTQPRRLWALSKALGGQKTHHSTQQNRARELQGELGRLTGRYYRPI